MSQTSDPAMSGAVRIAQLMGLPKWRGMSDMGLVARIEAGLPLAAAERIAARLGADDRNSRFALMSRATYSRMRKRPGGALTKEMSERLFAIARVLDEALRLWRGDDAAVARFLERPHPLLEGRTPFDVAKESMAGADLVARILAEARAGVAV